MPVKMKSKTSSMSERICIPTLDPRHVAGVRSVTEVAYTAGNAVGSEPYLVYNAVPWEECVTFRDVLSLNFEPESDWNVVDGMGGVRISRVLPELEVCNYVLNRSLWKEAMNDAQRILGVGGTCLPCLPAARAGETFACWIGTTIDDERDTQRDMTLAWRSRDIVVRPVLQAYERYILQRAERILVQSEYTVRRLNEKYNIPNEKVHRVPVPIDTTEFSPDGTDETGSPPRIVFVGRFTDPRKNIDLLIDAFARVKETITQARLTLVGDSPTAKLRERMEELGITDDVDFPGTVPSVVPMLQDASVFAIPSHQEGLCIAGLEAMSCGLPVVTTQCGGPEEYVVDGETGYVVDEDNADRFAHRLTQLLADDRRRREFGSRARRRIETEYALDTVLNDLTRHIEQIPTD